MSPDRPTIVVLTGPSGVGKGTVVSRLVGEHPEVWVSVSVTTRRPRPGEVDGVTYHFIDDARFDELVATGGLLEWACVHKTARYGTPRGPAQAAVAAGRTVLLELDLQGARQVKAVWPHVTSVFLAPPSWEELVTRLTGRGTEPDAARRRRLETAREELAAQEEFDHVVENRTVDQTVAELVDLLGLPATPEADGRRIPHTEG